MVVVSIVILTFLFVYFMICLLFLNLFMVLFAGACLFALQAFHQELEVWEIEISIIIYL